METHMIRIFLMRICDSSPNDSNHFWMETGLVSIAVVRFRLGKRVDFIAQMIVRHFLRWFGCVSIVRNFDKCDDVFWKLFCCKLDHTN